MENHKKRDYDYINGYNNKTYYKYCIIINRAKEKEVADFLNKQDSKSATIIKALKLLMESETNNY